MRDILNELTAKGVRADVIAEIEKWAPPMSAAAHCSAPHPVSIGRIRKP